jgi:hypothetical protein
MGKLGNRFLLFGIFYLIISCCEKISLSEEDIKLIDLYHIGDTVIFKSNLNNF